MPYSMESLQGLAQRNFGLSLDAAARLASGIDKRLNGITTQLYGKDAYGSIPELTTLLGGNGASLPGVTGSYWETPNHASLQIIGDLDVRWQVLDMSGATNINRAIMSKWPGGASNLGYEFRYNGFGFQEFVWSSLGTDVLTDTAGLYLGGADMMGRFTIDVVNGTDRILTWMVGEASPGVPLDIATGPWRTLLSKTVAGNTAIAANTSPLRVGARADGTGTSAFNGRIARVQLRDGINGTIVANPDFRSQTPGATTFVDSTGKTWTRAGTASIA